MKLVKRSKYDPSKYSNLKDYPIKVEADLTNIFSIFQGRVRFGDGSNGSSENMSGEFRVFTSSASPTASNAITHTLGSIPIGWIVVKQDNNAVLYTNSITATNTTITLVSSATSTNFTVFLLK